MNVQAFLLCGEAFFSHSSPFGHFGLLRSCGAIARLCHVGSRAKPPDKLCGDAITKQGTRGPQTRKRSSLPTSSLERGVIMSIFDANLIQGLIVNYGHPKQL